MLARDGTVGRLMGAAPSKGLAAALIATLAAGLAPAASAGEMVPEVAAAGIRATYARTEQVHRLPAKPVSSPSPALSPPNGAEADRATRAEITALLGQQVDPGGSIGACDDVIRRHEARHRIPRNLLRAVGIIESGRRIGDRTVAWAYTLNVDGQARYEDSAEAAGRLLRELVGTARSIDVGCMQINVTRWHPIRELDPGAPNPAFATVKDAFDPEKNVAYAARFLRSLFEREGDWTNAVARYHSGPYERRRGYVCRVAVEHARLEGVATNGPPLGCEPPLDRTVSPGPAA